MGQSAGAGGHLFLRGRRPLLTSFESGERERGGERFGMRGSGVRRVVYSGVNGFYKTSVTVSMGFVGVMNK